MLNIIVIPRIETDYYPPLNSTDVKIITNGFTSGKQYRAIKEEGNGFIVLNDSGHERFICATDRESTPHIVCQWMDGKKPMQESCGYFQIRKG